MFLNVCKQTFYISPVRISQKVKGALAWNLQHIIFMWRWGYWQIFKSALVYLWSRCLKHRLYLRQKKRPAINRYLIYHLKGMKIRILMFWEMQVSQNVKLFLKNLFSTINILNSYYLYHCWFINRSGRSHMFYKMDVLENIAKSPRKAPVAGLLFYKIAVLLFAVCKFIK